MDRRFSPAAAAAFGVEQAWRNRPAFVAGSVLLAAVMAVYNFNYVVIATGVFSAAADEPSAVYSAYANMSLPTALASLGMFLVPIAMQGALFRISLRADGSGWFAGLKFGEDEGRIFVVCLAVFGILVGAYIASYVAVLIVTMVFVLIGLALGALLGEAAAGPLAVLGLALAIPLALVWVGAAYYVMIRFAPAAAASVAERRFVVFDAWRMTKGCVFRMFLAYLLLTLAMFAILAVVGLLALAAVAGGDHDSVASVLGSPGGVVALAIHSVGVGIVSWGWHGVGAYAYLHCAARPETASA